MPAIQPLQAQSREEITSLSIGESSERKLKTKYKRVASAEAL